MAPTHASAVLLDLPPHPAMTMTRFRRVAQLWNWLPAFRGVAEHENLQRAAAALAVSPSALSRTVKLLEDALGAHLFVRHAAGLRLTPLGAELLGITRDAMRVVDDCIAAHEARGGSHAPLYVGVTSELAASVIAQALARRAETSVVHLRAVGEEHVVDELLQGDLDVVFGFAPRPRDVLCEAVGELRLGVYARQEHPLTTRSLPLTAEELAEARFVGPSGGFVDLGAERPWKIVVHAESLEAARTICRGSDLLGVFADLGDPAPLTRIADAAPSPLVYAMRRRPATGATYEPSSDALLANVRAALAAKPPPAPPVDPPSDDYVEGVGVGVIGDGDGEP